MDGGGSLWPSSMLGKARQLDGPVSGEDGNFLLADVRNQVCEKTDCCRCHQTQDLEGRLGDPTVQASL